MCLALPGKIVAIDRAQELLMGDVDFAGLQKQVCLAYTPEASVGDYVVVHVGFAITILNEKQAQSILDLIGTL